jgi:hypothetical protein
MIFKYFFGILMWLGLGIALSIALMPVFGMIWYPTVLLVFSLSHMVFLSVIAWMQVWKKNVDNVDIGGRIATTGYIHTLIGTCAALVATAGFDGSNLNDMQQIIKPIGAALGTSIIGWWMGNEIQRAVWGKEEEQSECYEQVDEAFGVLASSVRRLSFQLKQSGEQWENSVDAIQGKLNKASEEVVKEWQKSAETIKKQLNGAGNILVKACEHLNDEVDKASTGLGTATSTMSALSNSIESTLNTMEGNINTVAKNLETVANASEHTASSMTTISSGLEKMMVPIEKMAQSWEKAEKIIEEADKLLVQLRKEREERK